MNKNILLVLESFDLGGIARVSFVIADELNKKNNVTLYSTLSKHSYFQTNCTLVYKKKQNKIVLKFKKLLALLNFKLLGRETNPEFVYRYEIAQIIDYISENQIDTVILTARLISYSTVLKKQFPDLKVIGWAHNNATIYLEKYYRKIQSFFVKSISNLDYLVSLTKDDSEYFSQYIENSNLIHNPITIKNQSISKLDDKIISFVGRLDFEHKGIDYLIKVASLLPNGWKIIIAGTGTSKEIRKFFKMRKKLNAGNKIFLAGSLKDGALKKHYLNSSLYIMTSRWEGLPLVLAEAMSFGLPIVAFEQTGSKEVLVNGTVGILVENGNIKALSEQIKKLIEDENLRKDYQNRSIERFKDFKLEYIIKNWERII